MERKVLKWTTWSFSILTVVMCLTLSLMPVLNEDFFAGIAAIPEKIFKEKEENVEIGSNNTVVLDEDKLNIQIPDGLEGKDVKISTDYIQSTVYVRFAEAVEDYSEKYIVQGSSDHIANMTYYVEGDEGVLEIKLDKSYEPVYSFKDGFLCMEFQDMHEIYDKIIVIDAGHGGSMPGAVKKDVYEKNINLQIVLKLKALLDEVDEKQIKVFYTRLDDTNPELRDRVGMANSLEADLFISVHNNASATGKFTDLNGTMVLYNPNLANDVSKRLAEICLANVNASTGSKNLGLVKAEDIHIVRRSKVPVALIEVGYMTNLKELDNLCSDAYQKKAAKGIYNAIMQAFEEGF